MDIPVFFMEINMVMRNSSSRTAILVVGLLGAASLHVVDLDGLTGGQTAYAVPEGGDLELIFEVGKCPEFAICGKVVGTNGGCSGRPCCQGDDMYCTQSRRAGQGEFPRVKMAKEGTCYSVIPNDMAVWCVYTDCGENLCGAAAGCDMGKSSEVKRAKVEAGGTCGGDAS